MCCRRAADAVGAAAAAGLPGHCAGEVVAGQELPHQAEEPQEQRVRDHVPHQQHQRPAAARGAATRGARMHVCPSPPVIGIPLEGDLYDLVVSNGR